MPPFPVREARNDVFGRHLVAGRDLPVPGTVVWAQEPYAAVLYDEQVSSHCDYCFRPGGGSGGGLLRCGRSNFAHYCSQKHQKAAWRAYYREECKALLACAPHIPPASVRLAARVLWRQAREAADSQQAEHQAQQAAGGVYEDVQQLQSHWQQLDGARKIRYAQMAALTREYMLHGTQQQQHQQQQQQQQQPGAEPSQPNVPDVRHIAHLLARFACNNHTVCDEELRPIGVGLYPTGALINHTCRPNCVQSFQGRSIVFRSLHSIAAGEQLTISYVELAATRQERRRQLLQQYFFDIDGQQQQQQQPDEADKQAARCSSLLLTCQLPCSLAQANRPASALPSSSASSSLLALQSFGSSSQPPWPVDPADKALCQVQLAASQQRMLPGGACLLQAAAGHPEASDDASAAAAAGLFADLESVVGAGCEPDDSMMDDADDHQDAGSEAQGCTAAAEAAARQQMQPDAYAEQQQQQQQCLEAVQWGPWEEHAPDAGRLPAAAASAARLLLAVHQLHQQAETLTAAGEPAAAVQVCQHALGLADGAAALPAAEVVAAADDAGGDEAQPAAAAGGGSSIDDGSRCALGPQHILRARVDAGLLKALVDQGSDWQAALAVANRLTPVYNEVYPQVWPNLGLHHALVAKLAMLLEQPAAAAAAASKAASILQVTHGSDSTVLQEVMRLAWEAQQELAAMRAAGVGAGE